MIRGASKMLKVKKSSRSESLGDFNRRLQKLSDGMDLSPTDRYTNWCKWINDDDRKNILLDKNQKVELIGFILHLFLFFVDVVHVFERQCRNFQEMN